MKRRGVACIVGVFGLLAPGTATALTVGRLPSADPGVCSLSASEFALQTGSTSDVFSIPAGGGLITSWSTAFQPAGALVGLIVTKPFATPGPGGTATIVAVDRETIPTPAPASNVATFTLSQPIVAHPGDLIGIVTSNAPNARCVVTGAASEDTVAVGPAPGLSSQTVTTNNGGGSADADISVELSQSVDIGVSGSAAPSAVPVGGGVDLRFAVTGMAPLGGTFTDTLPAGLSPIAALSDTGTCSILGQAVSCAVGAAPATVHVFALGLAAGTFRDTGSIAGALSDPSVSNNAATVSVSVTGPVAPKCHVPALGGAPLSVARSVLPLVGCRVGRVTHASSRRVLRGAVISTKPGSGAVRAAGTRVAVVVSSGPPAPKPKPKPKRKRMRHR